MLLPLVPVIPINIFSGNIDLFVASHHAKGVVARFFNDLMNLLYLEIPGLTKIIYNYLDPTDYEHIFSQSPHHLSLTLHSH